MEEWEFAGREGKKICFQLKEGQKVVGLAKVIKGEDEKSTLVFFYTAECGFKYLIGYTLKTIKELVEKIEKEVGVD